MTVELEKQFPLGFESGFILPGETCLVTTRPQVVFRGERVHIRYDIAKLFRIDSIRVGYNNQMIGPEPIPADVFSLQWEEDGSIKAGECLDFELAQVGVDIVFEVTNISVVAEKFSAVVIGRIPA